MTHIITGTGGADTLAGTPDLDEIRALAGADWITASAGSDDIFGGPGTDMVTYSALPEARFGSTVQVRPLAYRVLEVVTEDGIDYLTDVERVTGSSFADRFVMGGGEMRGLGGNDTFVVGGHPNGLPPGQYDGGAGFDVVDYRSAVTLVSASLETGRGTFNYRFTDIEGLIGSQRSDRLTGDDGDNLLDGQSGADTLEGGLGNDTLEGGSGGDILQLSRDTDVAVFGGQMGDYDIIHGGGGSWTVAARAGSGREADGTDTLRNIERLRFEDGDLVYGTDQRDAVTLPAGRALLGAGNDILWAEEISYRRYLYEGAEDGPAVYKGGTGTDTLSWRHADEGISASLFAGRGWTGDAAGDRFDGFEILEGTQHDDQLWGSAGRDTLIGLNGDDTLAGSEGDDYILAGVGTDVILYRGNQADYRITRETDTLTRVEHLGGGLDGTDLVGHAEILRFADGDVIV